MFAYGQTGSGKTFTVSAVTKSAVRDLFQLAKTTPAQFALSFYEIYGGRVIDLLGGKKKLQVQEDGNQRIQIPGLEEKVARNEQEMLEIINFGHSVRTTHCTAANDTSSRSHAVCTVYLRDPSSNKQIGKLLMVDLAGSERAADT